MKLKLGENHHRHDATYPPMEFYDESGEIVGFDIDLGKAIAEELGVEAVFIDTAWDGIFLLWTPKNLIL